GGIAAYHLQRRMRVVGKNNVVLVLRAIGRGAFLLQRALVLLVDARFLKGARRGQRVSVVTFEILAFLRVRLGEYRLFFLPTEEAKETTRRRLLRGKFFLQFVFLANGALRCGFFLL